MFSIPGVLGLIFLTYVRPQAFVLAFHGVPLLHMVYATAAIGFIIDLRMRLIRVRIAPLMWLAVLYFLWILLSLAIGHADLLGAAVPGIVILFALFFMTAQAVQSFRALRTVVIALALISVFLSVVGIHQGLAPFGCFGVRGSPTAAYDGRSCEKEKDCVLDGDPGVSYRCEKIGLFDTHSVTGRVRWLGIIEDPNELAMCISLCVPLLIGLYLRKPSTASAAVLVLGSMMFMWCVVYTQSRGGQLVFVAALGVYFVRRYGVRGAIIVGVLAAPLFLLGGRSGGEADESKLERIEALYVASTLTFQRPLLGVGFGQFTEFNGLTAHNSYALSGAELGLPGMAIFIAVFYQSMKSFITVTRRYTAKGPARVAVVWAGALSAAQVGIMVGVFFLSFNTSPILWTFLGVCNGFQLAVLRHDPQIDLKLHRRDVYLISAITLSVASFLYVYSHRQAG